MRENIFRGKRISDDEWVYGYLIGEDVIAGDIVEFNDEYFNTEFWWGVDKSTVGQGIDLKDKNNKRFYERDIVEYEEENGVIKYCVEDAMYIIEFDGWVINFGQVYGYDLEIIGNIDDNPELLEN